MVLKKTAIIRSSKLAEVEKRLQAAKIEGIRVGTEKGYGGEEYFQDPMPFLLDGLKTG